MAKRVNLDTSETVNITCRRGDTFSLTLTLKDSSGTALQLSTLGYEFLMEVRDQLGAVSASEKSIIIGSPGVGKVPDNGLSFTFTTDDSGNVTITASAESMRSVPAGSYVYDLQQIVGGVHTTIIDGSFVVNEDVSKSIV
tara:strand:+ start:719 stop:1138 length:420 start_codon:yes stop_codon:yes gene_type:complete